MTRIEFMSCVVGSRLHGLNTPESDYDNRVVYLSEIKDMLSPWKQQSTSVSKTEDHVGWELTEFFRLCTSGNPTTLEFLYGFQAENINAAIISSNRNAFLNNRNIYNAHRGYARSQRHDLANQVEDKRGSKSAAAFIRIFLQGKSLLLTGRFNPNVIESDYDHDVLSALLLLRELKRRRKWTASEKDFIYSIMNRAEAEMEQAWEKCDQKKEAEIDWLESLIDTIYREGYLR